MRRKTEGILELRIERPKRANLSAADSLKRMKEFSKRREKFIATVRKGKNRSLLP